MRIGITDHHRPNQHFDRYGAWLRSVDPSAELVKLSYLRKNLSDLSTLDGLLLTGGGDVHPSLYGMNEAIGRVEEVDDLRDDFELKVIEEALEKDLPILGICRGMQIMNVYLGGTLHIDLVAAGFNDHAGQNGAENRHPVQMVPNSLLEIVAGTRKQDVNSVHHQAPEKLGKGLMISAVSGDGVIEAAEWILKDRMPFLLLVQWHPERMESDHPCSKNIAEYFLREAGTFSLSKQFSH